MSGVVAALVDDVEPAAGFRDWARRYREHITPILRDVGIDPDGTDLIDRLNEAMAGDPESRAGAVARLWSLLWVAEYEPPDPFAGYEIGLAAAVLSIRHLAPDVTYGREKRAVNRERAEKAAAAKVEKAKERSDQAARLSWAARNRFPDETVEKVAARVRAEMVLRERKTGVKPYSIQTLASRFVPARRLHKP